jgi:hypothetical protein
MQPLDKLVTKIDPLFKAAPFDAAKVPAGLKLHKLHKQLLEKRNGGFFYGGALHVLGACAEPAHHSLEAWNAPDGWRAAYGEALTGLVFFAMDAFGDQFGVDDGGKVFVLRAEEGIVEELADDFEQWLLIATEAPDELLGRGTFVQWVQAHGHLPHGEQLQAYPPFRFLGEDDEPQLEAVDAFENMAFHGQLVRSIVDAEDELPPGEQLKIEFTEEGIQLTTEPIPADEAQG